MTSVGRVLRAGVALALLACLAGPARANDGFFSFFQNAFGGGQPQRQASVPPYDPGYGEDAPPLVVRRHSRRQRSYAAAAKSPQDVLAESRGVTLYTDRTLVRGDVVMTAHGLRMFAGSGSWPYTDGDFVPVSAEAKLPPETRRELKSIDLASRIASRN